jgi:energy-converting hydrogenase Eha subunit C
MRYDAYPLSVVIIHFVVFGGVIVVVALSDYLDLVLLCILCCSVPVIIAVVVVTYR